MPYGTSPRNRDNYNSQRFSNLNSRQASKYSVAPRDSKIEKEIEISLDDSGFVQDNSSDEDIKKHYDIPFSSLEYDKIDLQAMKQKTSDR